MGQRHKPSVTGWTLAWNLEFACHEQRTSCRQRVGTGSSPACPCPHAAGSAGQERVLCSPASPILGAPWRSSGKPPIPPYQGVFRHTQDHIVQHGSTAEVLGYGQAAQAVAGVVEVPGPGRMGRLLAGVLCSPPAPAQPLTRPPHRRRGPGSTHASHPTLHEPRSLASPSSIFQSPILPPCLIAGTVTLQSVLSAVFRKGLSRVVLAKLI